MKKSLFVLALAAALVASCAQKNPDGTQPSLTDDVRSVIAKVESGATIVADDVQKALPYICWAGRAADAGFAVLVLPKHPEWAGDEAKAIADLNTICDPSFKVTDPSSVLKTALSEFKAISSQAAGTWKPAPVAAP